MTTDAGPAVTVTRHSLRLLSRTSLFYSLSRALLFAFLMACVSGIAVHAQTGDKKPEKPYALIFGTVWDAQSRPVYGVRIKIRRDDQKKAKWELVSDHRGEFALRVPPGQADYVIWAEVKSSKKGDKSSHPVETKAHIENDERVDVGLHLTE